MILATSVPYTRQRGVFGPADQFGKLIAHQDLLEAALLYGAASEAVVIADTILPRAVAHERQVLERAIVESGAVGQAAAMRFLPLMEAPAALANKDVRLLCGGPMEAARFGQFRTAIGAGCLPITTLIHAVAGPDVLSLYLGLLAGARAYDTMVVTSRAAERAVRCLLSSAASLVNGAVTPEIVRIPLGVSESAFCRLDKAAGRASFGIDPEAVVVLYLGRITEEYKADLEPLLVAFAKLAECVPQAVLVIAGQDVEGFYSGALQALARELQVAQRVRFVVNFPHCAKQLLYSIADIFVSPADNIQESFGIALIEAMAAGLPVVATDWSGYRDIVVHGETGFLIPCYWNELAGEIASWFAPVDTSYGPAHHLAQNTVYDVNLLAEHLCALGSNPDLRARMGLAGMARARAEFCWVSIIGSYAELWREQQARAQKQEAGSGEREGSREQGAGSGNGGAPLDFNALFKHYASGVLDETGVVYRTGRPAPHADASVGGGASGRQTPAEWILSRCDEKGIAIGTLLEEADPFAVVEMVRLIKKGYLGIR